MDSREPTRLTTPQESSGVILGGCGGGPNNSYGHNLQNNPILVPPSAGTIQSAVHLPFINMSSSTSRPAEDSSSMMYSGPGDGPFGIKPCGRLSISEPVKKKRGRPRKYGPDGSMPLYLMSPSAYVNSNTLSSESTGKKRGRPLGCGKKHQVDALGSSGTLFAPHIITVNAGEDIASKIMAFLHGAQTVCVISANGVICNVSLCQPATSGGTITYEGLFEIISLSGSFLLMDDGCTRSRSGGLSVALADSEGHVLGGGVAGMLVAATPVQVVVGSFTANRNKPQKPNSLKNEDYSFSAPLHSAGFGEGTCADSPPSHGAVSESSDDDDKGSPSNHNAGNFYNLTQPPVSSMSPCTSLGWPEAVNFHLSRHDTDTKMMPN